MRDKHHTGCGRGPSSSGGDDLAREVSDRLIPKKELLQLVGLSFPTVWRMMMAGQFPRARQNGGKTVWLKSEIDQYIATLPLRPYKGDVPQTEREPDPKAADRKLKSVASNNEEETTDSSDESG